MKKIAMIPARYAATRFPGKLMQDLGGKSVIVRTYESTIATQLFDEVSKKTAQALKVNVDAGSGDDANPGTMMQSVRTLERAFELCL